MKLNWKIGITVATLGMTGALLHNQDMIFGPDGTTADQNDDVRGTSMRSASPDTTPYMRAVIAEDYNPGGIEAFGAKTQGLDADAVDLLSADPGIFLVDVVVNNTDADLTNTDNANDGETSIAINPNNPDQIVIAAFSGQYNPEAPIYHSIDGGLTWTREDVAPPAPGWPAGCPCDWTWNWGRNDELPSTILAPSPTVFTPNAVDIVSNITTDPTSTAAYQYLGNPAQETNNLVASSLGISDQPWLLVNPDPFIASQDNIYVAYDDFSGAPDMRVAVSYGVNPPDFTVDIKVGESTNGVNPGIRLAEDSRTGAMWVLWGRDNGAGDDDSKDMDYMLNKSTDGGATWPLGGGSGIIAASGDSTQPYPKFGTVNSLLGGFHHAAVDPTTGDLYYVYGDRDSGTNNDRLSIKKISSDGNGGLILGDSHFVTGQVEAAIPQVAVSDNGIVAVFHYTFDGFSSDDFPIFTAHLAISEDEGVTFVDNELITFLSSAKNSCPGGGTNVCSDRQRVLGDYMQMEALGNCFYGSFTANGAPFGRPVANHDPIFFKTCVGPEVQIPSDVFFGDVCQGSSENETLEVCNSGTEALFIESITPSDAQFSIATPSGGFPVEVGVDQCFPFSVGFTPTTAGPIIADAVIVSSDPNSPVTVSLEGNVPIAEIITFIADSGDYGELCSGEFADLNLTIQSNGSCPLEIDSVVLSGTDSGDFDLPDGSLAGTIIEAGNSLQVPVRYTPVNTSDANPRTASVDVASSTQDGDSLALDQTPVQGTTGLASVITLIADSGDFGDVCTDTIGDLNLTIQSNGSCDLEVDSLSLSGVDSADFQLPNGSIAGSIIEPGNSLVVPVRFAPSNFGDPTPRTASADLASHTPGGDALGLNQTPLQGTVPPPDLNVAIADSGEFGDVCATEQADLNLTLFNQGLCNLTISDITSDNGLFQLPTDITYPLVLSHDADFNFPIRFAPEECSDDPITGTITIESDSPGEESLPIGVSGEIPCPNLVIDPVGLTGDFAFPATVMDLDGSMGCYSERTTVVRNNGLCPLTITAIASSAVDEYTVQSPSIFPVVLDTGEETLEVTVRFTPQSAGNHLSPDEYLGELTIVSDDPDGNSLSALCGEGVARSGIRTLVVDTTSGEPVAVDSVDSMTVKSKGKKTPSPINMQFTDVVPQTATICGNVIDWHLDLENLPATETTGSKGGKSQYEAYAREGNLQDSRTFRLGQCEFSEFQMQLLDSGDGGDPPSCPHKQKGESCSTDAECCSFKCKGPNGNKSCK